jgi:hypothetical protein
MKWQGLNLTINELNRWRKARANKHLDTRTLDKAIAACTEHLACQGLVREGNNARYATPRMSIGWMEQVRNTLIGLQGFGVDVALRNIEHLLDEAHKVNEYAMSAQAGRSPELGMDHWDVSMLEALRSIQRRRLLN